MIFDEILHGILHVAASTTDSATAAAATNFQLQSRWNAARIHGGRYSQIVPMTPKVTNKI